MRGTSAKICAAASTKEKILSHSPGTSSTNFRRRSETPFLPSAVVLIRQSYHSETREPDLASKLSFSAFYSSVRGTAGEARLREILAFDSKYIYPMRMPVCITIEQPAVAKSSAPIPRGPNLLRLLTTPIGILATITGLARAIYLPALFRLGRLLDDWAILAMFKHSKSASNIWCLGSSAISRPINRRQRLNSGLYQSSVQVNAPERDPHYNSGKRTKALLRRVIEKLLFNAEWETRCGTYAGFTPHTPLLSIQLKVLGCSERE